jgi:cell division septal protein FtsQ
MADNTSLFDKLQQKHIGKTKSVLVLIAIIIGMIILCIISFLWSSNQPIRNIKISGNIVLSSGEINACIDSLIMNIASSDVDLDKIKSKLLQNEYIADADVWFNSKGMLGIDIKERVPIATIVDAKGDLYFCDQAGTVFAYRLFKEYADLPIISNTYYSKSNEQNKTALQGAISIVCELGNDFQILDNMVSEVRYLHSSRSYELYLTAGNINVLLGRGDYVADKLSTLYAFLKSKVLHSANIAQYKHLDARWKDLIISIN